MRKLQMPYVQIRHAALRIYAAEGARGLTMRALGRSLGVCASALYRHYKNKDAILEAVVDMAERRLAQRLKPSPRLRPPQDRAGFMAERALLFALEQPNLFGLIIRRKAHWHGEGTRRAAAMRAELQKAMAEGQLRPDDPEAALGALWAQLCGLIALRERGDLPPLGRGALRAAWTASTERMLQGLRAA